MPIRLLSLLLGLFCGLPATALAWSNHALGTALSLQNADLLGVEMIKVESLEDFLAAERVGLQQLLDEQEAYARANFPGYPERPEALRWQGSDSPDREAFLRALRINPQVRLANFIQAVPGNGDTQERKLLPREQVMVYRDQGPWSAWGFYGLQPGEQVSPLAVIASAADEPDYGHDINLFSDNPGSVGAEYSFGAQPFGDQRFEYSSQAPFHMGFYHEPAIVYAAAPFLARTLPHWRAYQYFSLARFAFASGHPYWGYRFTGWGLHYVQDLTQPYHSSVSPGSTLFELLRAELLDVLGYSQAKQAAITRAADNHSKIEALQFDWLRELLATGASNSPILEVYADQSADTDYRPYDDHYLREVIASQSREMADPLDAQISAWRTIRQNPRGFSDGNQLQSAVQVGPGLEQLLVALLRNFGAHSRNAVRVTRESQAE
jgi:hypothetical protein